MAAFDSNDATRAVRLAPIAPEFAPGLGYFAPDVERYAWIVDPDARDAINLSGWIYASAEDAQADRARFPTRNLVLCYLPTREGCERIARTPSPPSFEYVVDGVRVTVFPERVEQ